MKTSLDSFLAPVELIASSEAEDLQNNTYNTYISSFLWQFRAWQGLGFQSKVQTATVTVT